MTNTVIMLVGLPMTGKSTFLNMSEELLNSALQKMNVEHKNNSIVISSDDMIEMVAKNFFISYNEAWNCMQPYLSDAFEKHVKDFFEKSEEAYNNNIENVYDVVFWDQTNLTKKSRMKKLKMIPSRWKKIALYFPEPSNDELKARKQQRKEIGKEIPDKVYKNMKKTFDFPDIEEGFDEIYRITQICPELYEGN